MPDSQVRPLHAETALLQAAGRTATVTQSEGPAIQDADMVEVT